MSAAFDTIKREELLKILSKVVGDDELRMIRLLLSDTTLDIKMNDVTTTKFPSNIGYQISRRWHQRRFVQYLPRGLAL